MKAVINEMVKSMPAERACECACALRFARLDYLKSSSPAFTSPYYWAAYEVVGGTSPVTRNIKLLILLTGAAVAAAVIFAVFYFRRRRILAARSL